MDWSPTWTHSYHGQQGHPRSVRQGLSLPLTAVRRRLSSKISVGDWRYVSIIESMVQLFYDFLILV